MSKIRFELNRAGVRELLRSKEAMEMVQHIAYSAKSRLGEGYEVTYRTGKNRVNASVAAVSEEALRENLHSNTILKAMGGGYD